MDWTFEENKVGSIFSVPHSQAAKMMLTNWCWQTQLKHLSN